jgi:RHS repeat-associated protein
MGRRVEKVVNQETNRFIYDGWNLVRELRTGNSELRTNSYVWGLDLSGSLQGAGGIGGLLSSTLTLSTNSTTLTGFYAYDANGNVTELVDDTGTNVAAAYTYDPYGNLLSCEGTLAQINPFRFSTKYLEDRTGLYYYGYRYYSPDLGRWLSPDPIGEMGGLNTYAFIDNAVLAGTDMLGLFPFYPLSIKHKPLEWFMVKLAWFSAHNTKQEKFITETDIFLFYPNVKMVVDDELKPAMEEKVLSSNQDVLFSEVNSDGCELDLPKIYIDYWMFNSLDDIMLEYTCFRQHSCCYDCDLTFRITDDFDLNTDPNTKGFDPIDVKLAKYLEYILIDYVDEPSLNPTPVADETEGFSFFTLYATDWEVFWEESIEICPEWKPGQTSLPWNSLLMKDEAFAK